VLLPAGAAGRAWGVHGAPGARERVRAGVKVLARVDLTLTGATALPDPLDPPALADRLAARVEAGEVDGYVLLPAADPGGHGLDAFVGQVVPLLQARGALRTAYRGATLRDHLGLTAHEPPPSVPPIPAWKV
jgi:hypothetical protein